MIWQKKKDGEVFSKGMEQTSFVLPLTLQFSFFHTRSSKRCGSLPPPQLYSHPYQMMLKEGHKHLSPVENLMAGGMAGVTSLLCTYPLDLIRSRLTVQTTETKYTGIMDTYRTVVREEGYLFAVLCTQASVMLLGGVLLFCC